MNGFSLQWLMAAKPITLRHGTQVAIYNATLEHRDIDRNGALWTEKTEKYGAIQFDYFFLTQGANDEFLSLDHIYPEEFPSILEASDHIPVVWILGMSDWSSLQY